MPAQAAKRIFGMMSTRHSLSYTSCALQSFIESTTLRPGDEFLLLDNDKSFSKSALPPVPGFRLVCNEREKSFAENANYLVDASLKNDADLFLMNNDVIFTRDWLAPFDEDTTSILSPLCNREVQYAVSVVTAKTAEVISMMVTDMVMQLADYEKNPSAFQTIAAAHKQYAKGFWRVYVFPFFCARIPLAVMKTLGRFDESFGKGGGEDYDYALRACLAGFETKYALNSYLFHFGGKSSWGGAETKTEQLQRENKFKTVFEAKWGTPLFQLILQENASVIESIEGLRSHDQAGELRSVIEQLVGKQPIQIRL